MKICHVMLCMNPGGAERVVSILSDKWIKKGHDISIILLVGDEWPVFYDLNKKIKLYKLNVFKKSNNFLEAIKINFKRLSGLRNKIKEINPDLIISHCPREIALTYISTLSLKYPIYGYIHSDLSYWFHELNFEKSLFWKLSEYISFSLIQKCLVLDKDTVDKLPYFARSKAQTIFNPVLHRENIKQLPNYTENKNIITVGSLTDRKNHEFLIEAFATISSKFKEWNLTIIGEGPLKSRLNQKIIDLNLTSRIFLVGSKQDIEKEFLKSSIFVLPSLGEGFCMSVIEAMAHGLPIVITNSTNINSVIVRQNIDGKIVQKNSTQEMSLALQELIQNPELRYKMGKNATEITHRFSLEKTLNMWDQILTQKSN